VVLEQGLGAALQTLAANSTVATTVVYEPAERLPEPVELAAYFVGSEALANVTKYADATRVTMPSGAPARWRRSRSPTTACAARTVRRARACAAWPTTSRRSRAGCGS
jgi:hypothetical protein